MSTDVRVSAAGLWRAGATRGASIRGERRVALLLLRAHLLPQRHAKGANDASAHVEIARSGGQGEKNEEVVSFFLFQQSL